MGTTLGWAVGSEVGAFVGCISVVLWLGNTAGTALGWPVSCAAAAFVGCKFAVI